MLEKADFMNILSNYEIKRIERRLFYLMKNVFYDFNEEYIRKICSKFEKIKFQKGEFVYKEGDAV